MLEAIRRVERYAARGRDAFEADELIQSWVVRHLQIIGEAARALSAEFRDAHPEVPWPEIIGMRTIIVHRYFDVDLDVVWTAVDRDLPTLRQHLEAIGPDTS
jgi:uncharacterized protein with HEPN domain